MSGLDNSASIITNATSGADSGMMNLIYTNKLISGLIVAILVVIMIIAWYVFYYRKSPPTPTPTPTPTPPTKMY